MKTPLTSFLRILSIQSGRRFFLQKEKSEKEKESRLTSAIGILSSLAPLPHFVRRSSPRLKGLPVFARLHYVYKNLRGAKNKKPEK